MSLFLKQSQTDASRQPQYYALSDKSLVGLPSQVLNSPLFQTLPISEEALESEIFPYILRSNFPGATESHDNEREQMHFLIARSFFHVALLNPAKLGFSSPFDRRRPTRRTHSCAASGVSRACPPPPHTTAWGHRIIQDLRIIFCGLGSPRIRSSSNSECTIAAEAETTERSDENGELPSLI
jgi:hypothetical protein